MEIIREVGHIKGKIPYPILTLGNFDGVHLGHQAIFKKMVEKAKEMQGTSIVFTFKGHTLKVLAPGKSPPLLTTFKEKMELIEKCGIDMVLCVGFTKEFAGLSPRDFVKEILVDKIGAKEIIVGCNCTFGKGGEGNIDYFKKMEEEFGYRLQVVEPIRSNGYVASSSLIRNLIEKGDVDEAAQLLGRNYLLSGKVIERAKIRKSTDYIMVKIDSHQELTPTGIYFATIEFYNLDVDGIVISKNNGLSFKIYMLNFNGKFYEGEHILINFVKRIYDASANLVG